jgi:hypothetical protein
VQIKYISPVTLRVIIAGPVLKRLFWLVLQLS